MDEGLKEMGLRWADSFPEALAVVLVALVAAAYFAFKAKDLEPGLRTVAWSALAVFAVLAVAQWPAAYNKAKTECRREYSHASGQTGPFGSPPLTYRFSKCAKVWPNGPDAL